MQTKITFLPTYQFHGVPISLPNKLHLVTTGQTHGFPPINFKLFLSLPIRLSWPQPALQVSYTAIDLKSGGVSLMVCY